MNEFLKENSNSIKSLNKLKCVNKSRSLPSDLSFLFPLSQPGSKLLEGLCDLLFTMENEGCEHKSKPAWLVRHESVTCLHVKFNFVKDFIMELFLGLPCIFSQELTEVRKTH